MEKLLDIIVEDWGVDSSENLACQAIIKYLAGRNLAQEMHLTVSRFEHVLSNELEPPVNIELLMSCLLYLTGSRMRVLEVHFELIDIDDETTYQLSKSNVTDAQRGMLVHPRSGKLLQSATEHIFPYYSPSKTFQEIVKN